MTLAQVDIVELWRALGGGELQHGRGQAFWRGGDSWSVALDAAKGCYYDHRDGKGGGVLDLVVLVLGTDQRAALQWLEANAGLDSRRPEGRHALAQQRERARLEAEQIQLWHAGLLDYLEQTKALAVENVFANPEDETLEIIHATACAALHTAEQLRGVALIVAFRAARPMDTAQVDQLIAAAHADQLHADFCTAMVVAILAKKEASL